MTYIGVAYIDDFGNANLLVSPFRVSLENDPACFGMSQLNVAFRLMFREIERQLP